MRFSTILPALFAAATSAAKFQNYIDNSCQSYAGDFNFVSAKEQQQLTLQQFASVPEWSNKDRDLQCPHNKQNTYRYVRRASSTTRYLDLAILTPSRSLCPSGTLPESRALVPQYREEASLSSTTTTPTRTRSATTWPRLQKTRGDRSESAQRMFN